MPADSAAARRAYESWHARLDVDPEASSPWYRLVRSHLDPARDLAGRTLLEIGCGRGDLACRLAGAEPAPERIVAADFAATAVATGKAWAASRALPGICWEVADVLRLAHPEASFDTVVSCETIEHVTEPAQAVAELARVLKPGGRLFLTTPNYLGPMGLYRLYLRLTGRRYTEGGQPINHLMLLPRTRALVARAGLEVVRVDAVGHYLPFPGRPPIELPALDRPRRLARWVGLHSLVVGEKRRASAAGSSGPGASGRL